MAALPRTVVIGAGVSGLSSALRLAEAGAPVTIWARERPEATVSAVAAAVWYPYRVFPEDLVLGWARRSREVFEALAASSPEAGVAIREGVELFRSPRPDPWWRDAVRGFRRLSRPELPAAAAGGWRFEAPVIDMSRYLPFLEGALRARGVRIEVRAVGALEEVDAPVVVNCTGLGARALCGDPSVAPIRGQVVRVRNPGLLDFAVDDEHPSGMAYVIPRFEDAIIGGTADEGAWETEPDEAVATAILARCAELEPRLRGAERLGVKVGLRPGRPTIRLEVEERAGTTVVHNYGHGGAGVTVSWGCAEEVARRVARLPSG
jgi:D-amino-acid oxidase